MKKLLLLILLLLMSSPVLAQRRMTKKICTEVDISCTAIDTQEVVEFKDLFNTLVADLVVQLELQTSFNPTAAAARFADFNNRISALQGAKDAVTNVDAKNALQSTIDAVTSNRDVLDSTAPGSQRDNANKAPAEIVKLNLQMDSIESAIP